MGTEGDDNAARGSTDLLLSFLQLIFALLLCVIYFIFLTSFGGEFLIVIKGMWIVPLFLLMLVGAAVISVIFSVRSRRLAKLVGDMTCLFQRPQLRLVWILAWSLWSLIVVVPILWVGKVLALGALGSVPLVLIGLLTLPFLGYALFFFVNGVRGIYGMIRSSARVRLLRGSILSGFGFLFAFVGFALVALFWNPQWTAGVQHQPLFVPGEQPGRAYRIPAMIVLPGDTLLAFAESRQFALSDLLDIDLVMKRSTDGGGTWGDIEVLQDQGRHTVHSPCPLYDSDTRSVWLPYCVDYKTLYIIHSTDAGTTWSQPRNLSEELGLGADTWCHNGPGNGIQMRTGRLVIPTTLNEARVLYSDDHGEHWALGDPIGKGGEPQVFERVDGALCANLRSERGGHRIVACSQDGGEGWEDWHAQMDLPAAGTQGSILRFTSERTHLRNRVLFSNPGAPYRGEFTIRLSYDEGQSWPVSKQVYEGAAGYSQLAVLSQGDILALFEAGRYDLRQSITLVRLDLTWLTDGVDQLSLRGVGP